MLEEFDLHLVSIVEACDELEMASKVSESLPDLAFGDVGSL